MDGIERRKFDDPDWISEFQIFPVDRMAVSYQKRRSIKSGITVCGQTNECRGHLDTIEKLSPLVRYTNFVSSSFVCSEGCY